MDKKMTFDLMLRLYKLFDYDQQEVNIFGIRDISNLKSDLFNDKIGVLYHGKAYLYAGTTDPAKYYILKGGVNGNGVPFLALGQHKKMYCIDRHNGKYEALCNRPNKGCFPQTVSRDRNRNFIIDENEKQEKGFYGMNLHTTSFVKRVLKISRYSAGCQVVQNSKEFKQLINIVKSSEMYLHNSKPTLFNYTLFEKDDLLKI